MKKEKIFKVVLALAISINISLLCMIATKISANSSIIIVESAKQTEDITEVSSTNLAKDEENNNSRRTATSRGGDREPLQTISEEPTLQETSPAEEPVAKQAEPENIEQETSEVIEDTIIEEIEEVEEPVVEEKPTYKGVELAYSSAYNISSARLTKSKGVTYYNGHKETYYSQRVLPGKGLKSLNNNGRHVADDGTIRDGDGYIAVACNYLPKGSEIMTSLGPGKVYDTGSMTGKWIDIYVNW